MKFPVPAAPQSRFSDANLSGAEREDEKKMAPRGLPALDATFLNRSYRLTLWLGLIVACGVSVALHSVLIASSLFLGVLTGVLLLKSQEMFVRLAVRPPVNGVANPPNLKHIVPLVFLLPLKIAFIGGGLMLLWRAQYLNLWAFWAGFVLVQVVLLVRLLVHLTQAKAKSV